MIAKAKVRQLIEESEQELLACWHTLATLKSGKLPEHFREQLLGFQYSLAKIIFSLDDYYRRIRAEERRVIDRKQQLSPEWLGNTLKNYHEYRRVIKDTVEIARGLGDAFAWLFYRRDRDLIRKHLKHASIPNTPPGIGGKGELEFIRNVTNLDGQLLIYHGNTTFLRIGDVSFVDMGSLRVSAIAELKSVIKQSGDLRISVHFVGPRLPEHFPSFKETNVQMEGGGPSLPSGSAARLQRQIKEMSSLFEAIAIGDRADLRKAYHVKELKALASQLETEPTVYQRAGPGLLMLGVMDRRPASLWNRLYGTPTKRINRRLSHVVENTLPLLDSGSDANAIYLSHFDVKPILGGTPLFWWPVNSEFLRKLYFREIIVGTAYNPAHFVRKLRDLGFTVTHSNGKEFRFALTMSTRELRLENFEYFLHAIQVHLMREEAVVDIVKSALERVESGNLRAGDFLNDYEGITGYEQFRGDLPLMYFPTLDPRGALASLEMAPMRIRRFRLQRASGEEARWLTETLDRESRRFGARVEATPAGQLALRWG